ncbi:hypothetical protein CpipJ_CPIJ011821 [Culex quinquefasciatus]|uniref:Uncharacterized protein n=1 Tax=Culex quinquefasciatus TaxID=7176 RepID=B0WX79_CULQU|nr:hypothetical protein CpipJ_CPIJ011821 [Culex quinquefasciatus]|eukprot:XP_001862001.1 hypothetical protein CpipJ_CPIJ011821 [Culex quinquefasciatus]
MNAPRVLSCSWRETDRPNGRGGLASLDRGTERKRVRQVRLMSAYTTCTQSYYRLRVVRALTHGYDWSSTDLASWEGAGID